ncbi:MAG: hypothetical protein KDD44_10505, partial [Bdellovibrionales bacterium]|nr:hypothetical protein [Bdellovibrionales bacterium]
WVSGDVRNQSDHPEHMFVRRLGASLAAHVRATFSFSDGRLLFVDPRRFGTIRLLATREACEPAGVDPLSSVLTAKHLMVLSGRSSQEAKVWLMRQDRLVGIGNIYASEALFRANIHPKRPMSSLSPAEFLRLHRSLRFILRKAIAACGTTFSDFQDTTGSLGGYGRYLAVYGREGEHCRRCQVGTIERCVQAQRSTFFCANCQT